MRPTLLRAVLAFCALASGALAGGGPSFDCGKVHSSVLKTICASPKLSALDAELSNVYQNTLGQGGLDHQALARDEAAWMHATLNRCADSSCIEKAYTGRIAALKDQSLRAASPAAYDETRPFSAPPALLAEAEAEIGKSCGGLWDAKPGFLPGFAAPKGFLPVVSKSQMVFVREKQGARFAFLAKVGDRSCLVTDVAVLPRAAEADAFLQCSYGELPDISVGIGLRKTGVKKLVGYWEIDDGKLMRQPLGVLGVQDQVRCQQPETGD